MKTFTLNNLKIEIDEDIKKFSDLLIDSKNACDETAKQYLDDAYNAFTPDVPFENLKQKINNKIAHYISLLYKQSIFNVTKNDFLYDNMGYNEMITNTVEYYNNAVEVESKHENVFKSELLKAEKTSNSESQGIAFGIITDSVMDALIYSYMTAITLENETKKTQEIYQELSKKLCDEKENNIKLDNKKYFLETYIPQMIESIKKCYYHLLLKYINILDMNKLFDASKIQNINLKRSNDILENFYMVDDKYSVICNAISVCPFNENAYIYALENGFYNKEMDAIQHYFQLKTEIIKALNSKIDSNIIIYKPISESLNKYKCTFNALSVICCESAQNIKFKYYKLKLSIIVNNFKEIHNHFANKELTEEEIINNIFHDESWKNCNEKEIDEYLENKADCFLSKNDYEGISQEIGYNNLLKDICSILEIEQTNYNQIRCYLISKLKSCICKYNELKKIQDEEKKEKAKRSEIKTRLIMIVSSTILIVVGIVLMVVSSSNLDSIYTIGLGILALGVVLLLVFLAVLSKKFN
ncbi:MAG: hypothetical protein ACI4IE_05225 [Eubacterium sp.]